MRSVRFLLALLPALAACSDMKEPRRRVLVASSFEDAARAVLGDTAVVVPAASSTLARQIVNGAPADCFVSANHEWVAFLQGKGMIGLRTPEVLVLNELVLVVPSSGQNKVSLDDFRGTLAMGDPEHVPAGRYGKLALEAAGMWSRVKSKVIPTANVRQALALVERDEADCGLVYATDAMASGKVTVIHRFRGPGMPAVEYEVVQIGDGEPDLINALTGSKAWRIYESLGFRLVHR